jgi:hypothetical protein
MAGLVPAIHALITSKEDVDARHEAGMTNESFAALALRTARERIRH